MAVGRRNKLPQKSAMPRQIEAGSLDYTLVIYSGPIFIPIHVCIYAFAGSVKDSVVGEERIAQYLLAVLNTRGTPLQWKHLVDRETKDIHQELENKPESVIKDLQNKGKKPMNKSNAYRVQVRSDFRIWFSREYYIFLYLFV